MDKVLTHFKNNFAIYTVILVCLLVLIVALVFSGKKEDENIEIDTSMFNVINIEKALALFNQEGVSFLVIGKENDATTAAYVPYLKVAEGLYGFTVDYLDITNVDYQSKNMQKLIAKLDVEYGYEGKEATFGEFMGETPMTVVIKNKKMVFGNIGSMSETSIEALANNYGFNYYGQKAPKDS